MPRPADANFPSIIGAPVVRPALFVEAHFANEVIYVWSGNQTNTWNGHNWLGVGSLGQVSTIEEGSTVEAKGVALTVSGLDPTLVGDTLSHYQVGLPVIVYLGLFDGSGNLLTTPVCSFSGRMDQPTLSVSGDSASITINCESRLIDMNTSVERRYTHEDQQIDYPGDLGFEYCNSIQDVTIYWGRLPNGNNNFITRGH